MILSIGRHASVDSVGRRTGKGGYIDVMLGLSWHEGGRKRSCRRSVVGVYCA